MSPRQLGFHAAITVEDGPGELPEYVARDFDDDLRKHISARTEQGCFVLLVGRSPSGKTRSLYEAVQVIAPNWPIVQPADTGEILELPDGGRQRIIVWLDEMHRLFGADPQLTKERVIRLLHFPAIVVATLWPEDYLVRTQRGPDTYAEMENDGRLLDPAVDGAAVQAQLSRMHRRIGGGDESAARQLTTLLFDLREEAELRREVDAGTFQAAERLVALLIADTTVDRRLVEHIRTHGLSADGRPYLLPGA